MVLVPDELVEVDEEIAVEEEIDLLAGLELNVVPPEPSAKESLALDDASEHVEQPKLGP